MRRQLFPWQEKNIVLKQTKKRKNVIYGAQAVNKQLPILYYRPTQDWDIWSKNFKRDAYGLEKKLDRASHGDNYYTKKLKGTYPIEVYSVYERPSNKVADFTAMPDEKGFYTVIGGIRWQTLSHAKSKYRKILSDPQYKFRHEQARWDLWRIEQFEKQLSHGKVKKFDLPFMLYVRKRSVVYG